MLTSLRVFELQDFLSDARQSRGGRKPELVSRAIAAVQGDHRLMAKVKQLYEAKRGLYMASTGFRQRSTPYDKPTMERVLSPVASSVHGQGNKRGLMPVDVKFCPLAFFEYRDSIIRASYLSRWIARSFLIHLCSYWCFCVGDMSSSLYSRSRSDRSMASVHFQLTPDQVEQIRAGRYVGVSRGVTYG